MDPKKRTTILALVFLTILLGVVSVIITIQVRRNSAPDDSQAALIDETIAKFAGLTCEEVFAENENYAEIGGFQNIVDTLEFTGTLPEYPLNCSAETISGQKLNLGVELSEGIFENDEIISGYGLGAVTDTDSVGDFTFFVTQDNPTNRCVTVLLSSIEDFKVGVFEITENEERVVDCTKYSEDIRTFVNNFATNL